MAIAFVAGGTLTFFYHSYSDLIEQRLHGERERTLPRVYARPVDLRRGQSLSQADVVSRLNDLGYAQRSEAARPAEFSIRRNTIAVVPRGGELAGKAVELTFPPAPTVQAASGAAPPAPRGIRSIDVEGRRADTVRLDRPLLTALVTSGARQKRRHVPLDAIPERLRQAVITAEDQSFYSHPGINPFRLAAALFTNAFGETDTPVGNSTITQQLARMFFLADEFNAELRSGDRGRTWGSYWRKAREGLMSLVLERRAAKDEILELYLNDVYLGQRGSFAIHGVAEAARIFFGKDVANVTLSEGATIAGSILYPGTPFTNAKRAVERRNAVLRAMAGEGYIDADTAARASREPLHVIARAVDNEAPYFVDMVAEQVAEAFPGITASGSADIHTTLDLNMQRAAIEAVRLGLSRVDERLSQRRRPPGEQPQAALIAVDPRTGEILAMIGGRSYNTSQFNRAIDARRQPGSVFKPFVFLAAFEQAAKEGRTDLTPAALTRDEPASFVVGDDVWEPRNYDDYDGEITWRRALAMSRNLGTIRVGEQIGFDNVAATWRRVGVGTPPAGYPSITLGVFELTPLEVAEAYTLFLNRGVVRPLRAIERVAAGSRMLRPSEARARTVARPQSAFLVTHMMRSVMNEGTGAGARAAGFALDAAGKSGTTNDLRDAWFVGFTPELLTVVWVGFDSNRPLGLSGSQAALPIWTEFMKTVLAGRANRTFEPPAEGVVFADIDRHTGKRATPACPETISEAFLEGSEPGEMCPLHAPDGG